MRHYSTSTFVTLRRLRQLRDALRSPLSVCQQLCLACLAAGALTGGFMIQVSDWSIPMVMTCNSKNEEGCRAKFYDILTCQVSTVTNQSRFLCLFRRDRVSKSATLRIVFIDLGHLQLGTQSYVTFEVMRNCWAHPFLDDIKTPTSWRIQCEPDTLIVHWIVVRCRAAKLSLLLWLHLLCAGPRIDGSSSVSAADVQCVQYPCLLCLTAETWAR